VAAAPATGLPPLTEEEQIESAKYLPRDLPPRLFEEERFLFPESYGKNRVRLLVKDPEWIFAYWDVSPESVAALGAEQGGRAAALSRLTLRLTDPDGGGTTVMLLPAGARSWYVRTDRAARAYRAELGFTLPSGEFRPLALSNTIRTPRVGPSGERASRTVHYKKVRAAAAPAPPSPAKAETAGEPRRAAAAAADERPVTYVGADVGPGASTSASGREGEPRGGASDAFGPAGPGEVSRGGASDVHRR
jgi:hypothetical protein